MRKLLAAALLLVATAALAADAPKPVAIAVEPLGDSDQGVVVRVAFRFANPREITAAGLFLEGSFAENGQLPRNFRFAVPRKDDKWVWSNTVAHNDEIIRETRWTLLPDQRNEMATIQTLEEGKTVIEVRLVLERDRGAGPLVVAEGTETIAVGKTNRPFVAESTKRKPAAPQEVLPEDAGSVALRTPRRNLASGLYQVTADVQPPVKRVEFWVENKKILARHAPPYTTELDLGATPESVAVRAIGYDASGRYVDADAMAVADITALWVKLTRVATPDGVCHFKLSVRNPQAVGLKSIALYAGDRKLHQWDQPPFAASLPCATLAEVDSVRASVIDESGHEVSDVAVLRR
jgi:hypothetical protein